jgi:hypothetical protein
VTDPLTLSALTASALTEGIKFLYGQAAELLKRRRERSAANSDEEARRPDAPPLEGALEPLRPDPAMLQQLEPDLRELRRLIADYADEIEPADPNDRVLLERVDALRRMLEAIYGQRITFRGENRAGSGPMVEGAIDVGVVAGYAAAVRVKAATDVSTTIRGKATAEEVGATGEIIGVDINLIGDS